MKGRAYERFTRRGPLAVLPLTGGRAAVVWTLPEAVAESVWGLRRDAFRRELQRAFGYRVGRFERIGRRNAYPLLRVRSTELRGQRALLIGNAAVSLHPVAGQGFNLALRDVATIAELIADEVGAAGAAADPGSPALLAAYEDWRTADQRKVAGFTHGLVRLFGLPAPGLGALRGLGLVAFDLLPGAKAQLARHTMGMSGRLPRLARGMPLVDAGGA
jgi:2-octaprenyl-6-methoxyphenol hydroxylase